MKKKNIKKLRESSLFKSSTKGIIKSDLEVIKDYSEEMETKVEEEIKDMYFEDFFNLYSFLITSK